MKSTVVLINGTVGTIETKNSIEIINLINKYVVVEHSDENGLPMQTAGIMIEILE